MRICPTDDTSVINIEGVEYKAAKDGSFDVPEAVGEQLVAFPQWQREYEALDAALAAKAERDSDTSLVAVRVAELEARVAELEDENATLKKAKAGVLGALHHAAKAPAKKAAPAAKKAPAKKAAASPAKS
jgi:hypothetical protein